jgi:type IV secretory pathway TraG/TraD family ATPase VirD4
MPEERQPAPTFAGVLIGLLVLTAMTIALCERSAQALLAKQGAEGDLPASYQVPAAFLNLYLQLRYHVLEHWLFYSVLALLGPVVIYLALKKWLAMVGRMREERAGMSFKQASYSYPMTPFSLRDAIKNNPRPQDQVFLGLTDEGAPVYLTDHQRSMHLHVIGQTGSGKTRSVIEPLLMQDLRRGRGVIVVDGKASEENVQRLCAMAATSGRLDRVKLFYPVPGFPSHTYNPLHLLPDSDPRAIAEMVFTSFRDDLDNSYYRDQAGRLFRNLVCALAGTGKRFRMLDVAAAIASEEVLMHALDQSSDSKARRDIEAQRQSLGRKWGETFTGLLAAVQRYDHPAVNALDPDIVLEHEIETSGVVGFFLPANYLKQFARYMGLIAFQHMQFIGSLRQLDRSRNQTPVYVYADEFYSFAYEGFTDAVNKLRDAKISFLLAHQTLSDLQKVSPEYAKGIWENTRNKVVLYQNDPDLAELVAKGIGTQKEIEQTQRRSADGFLNSVAMLESATKEVDAYKFHPNRLKSLTLGQAYLVQDAEFAALNLQMIPDLAAASPPSPKPLSQDGIGLHERFLAQPPPLAKAK